MNDIRNQHRQAGAALIVGLVLLLVLTLLAVSTMRSAALELVMAGNTQNRETAFRLAEAGIADVVGRPLAFFNPTFGWQTDIGPEGLPGLRGSYQVNIRHMGSGQPTIGAYSADQFQFEHFQIDATGESDRGARSLQSQGLVRVIRK